VISSGDHDELKRQQVSQAGESEPAGAPVPAVTVFDNPILRDDLLDAEPSLLE
jgi:hypothetical protein